MTEPTPDPDTGTPSTTGDRSAPGMPRWVRVILIVAGALIALFLVLKLTGSGGGHGPGRHMGSGVDAARAAALSRT